MKQKIKNAIKKADISEEDWFEDILPMIEEYDRVVYATFKLEADRHSEALLTTDEAYRDELLAICDWDIWPKENNLGKVWVISGYRMEYRTYNIVPPLVFSCKKEAEKKYNAIIAHCNSCMGDYSLHEVEINTEVLQSL